jgi:hypothetical protein
LAVAGTRQSVSEPEKTDKRILRISKQSPRPLEELVAVPNVTAITESKRTLEALNQ